MVGARLVVIGGAEDKVGERRVLREFVRMAGGADARVVIVPVGSSYPEAVGAEYEQAFRALGVREAKSLQLSGREQAKSRENLE